jgi:D-3-phosphoglycerate dehydrogenase
VSSASRVVVIAEPIDPGAVRQLREAGLEVVDATSGEAALLAALPRAWALVARSRTRVTASLMDRALELRVVARAGVGVDNVDLAHATGRGIQVVNAPTAATTSVAELTVVLLLLLVRELLPRIDATKAGSWQRGTGGSELAGKTVGFVGYGRIAREVARRLGPFGVSCVAFDPYVSSTGDSTSLVKLDALLAASHFVSLHAVLTPETHHLINAERIAQMSPKSFLLNVARGGLVDEEALLRALDSGALAGAALDVFETEPPEREALLKHPRVIPTPHLGASTTEAQERAGTIVAEELLRIHRGERPKFLVNPELGGTR